MATTELRIGIVGFGPIAMEHVDRLLAIDGVTIVGCADADPVNARTLASHISSPLVPVLAFGDHQELIRESAPDALVILTPHHSHYRVAMDGLQAGCHLFLTMPLSTSVQEAVDIVGLAQARDRKVSVGHRFRFLTSLIRAREMLTAEAIGKVRFIKGTLAMPWQEALGRPERPDAFDSRSLWSGVLATIGVDLVDALLWISGGSAETISAIQSLDESGRDLATAASIRLENGVLASIAISGIAHGPYFEFVFHGERGRLRATLSSLDLAEADDDARPIPLPENDLNLDANFVDAIREGSQLSCPASEALNAVRVLEAISRSAAIGQFVGLT